MPDGQHVITPVERPDEHPAFLAWRGLGLTGIDPTRIDVLKESEKTLACRLVACGPAGENVVAKRRATEATLVERTIYRDVLVRFDGPSLRFLGAVDEPQGGTTWMFLDDGGEVMPDLCQPAHRALAGSWLGRLHSDLVGVSFGGTLPDRGAGHALDLLHSDRADLHAAMANPHLDAAGLRLVRALGRRLDRIEAIWPRIEAEVSGLPTTLVHGDFQAKNLRLRQDGDGPSIVPFDWEMSGWGPPLADLASIDLEVYGVEAGRFWGGRVAALDHLVDIGRLFGLLAAVSWEGLALQTPWLEHPMYRLAVYEERLAAALVRLCKTTPATDASRPSRA